ncbi:MAG: sulfocyanin-like copper-binding protein [Gemmatimonadales bacterium]
MNRPFWLLALAATLTPRLSAQQRPPQEIDPSWLTWEQAARTVTFRLIAAHTGLYGGLNFNGFGEGQLTVVVPLGWTTVMDFYNNDAVLPHSAEVIADQTPVPTGPVDPAIPRAYTARLAQGIPPGQSDGMRFVAEPAGEYLIFCAVPGHGLGGMWIRLRVSAEATEPAMVR